MDQQERLDYLVEKFKEDSVRYRDMDVPEDTAFVVKDSVTTKWIAEWNFNDSLDVGLDATGNVHNATIGEGSVPTVDGIARFDGQSGFLVKLAKDIEALNIDTNEVETLEANTIVEPFYAYKEGMDFNVGDRRYTIAFELTNSGYEYDGVSIDEYITVID